MFIIDNMIDGSRPPIPGNEPEQYSGIIGDRLIIGSGSLGERPNLAASIAYAISTWAELENYLWACFAELMDLDAPTAMSIITSIDSDGGRRAALSAIARSKLLPNEAENIMRFVNKMREKGKRRNNLAHGVWAVDSGIPDGVILIDQRTHLLRQAERHSIQAEISQLRDHMLSSNSTQFQAKIDKAYTRLENIDKIDFAGWRIYRQIDFDKVCIITDHLKCDLFDLSRALNSRKTFEQILQQEKEPQSHR